MKKQIRELDERNVSIVSNNCVAGILYEWAGLRKQTPTAGIYFTGDSYRHFLDDLSKDRIDEWSKLESANLVFKDDQGCWALDRAAQGELVFLHYSSPDEAVTKWNRRMERLRGRTLLVISSIRDQIARDPLMTVLTAFRFTFMVDGDTAPAADVLVLNSEFLRAFSRYVDQVINGAAERLADEITIGGGAGFRIGRGTAP
ncbi:MAG TPA: DUF1919 domain-containing protein [Sphingomicrobium sp.]|nr:DUF1919 domain-containing protein [Sphingomicrobium sp.]